MSATRTATVTEIEKDIQNINKDNWAQEGRGDFIEALANIDINDDSVVLFDGRNIREVISKYCDGEAKIRLSDDVSQLNQAYKASKSSSTLSNSPELFLQDQEAIELCKLAKKQRSEVYGNFFIEEIENLTIAGIQKIAQTGANSVTPFQTVLVEVFPTVSFSSSTLNAVVHNINNVDLARIQQRAQQLNSLYDKLLTQIKENKKEKFVDEMAEAFKQGDAAAIDYIRKNENTFKLNGTKITSLPKLIFDELKAEAISRQYELKITTAIEAKKFNAGHADGKQQLDNDIRSLNCPLSGTVADYANQAANRKFFGVDEQCQLTSDAEERVRKVLEKKSIEFKIIQAIMDLNTDSYTFLDQITNLDKKILADYKQFVTQLNTKIPRVLGVDSDGALLDNFLQQNREAFTVIIRSLFYQFNMLFFILKIQNINDENKIANLYQLINGNKENLIANMKKSNLFGKIEGITEEKNFNTAFHEKLWKEITQKHQQLVQKKNSRLIKESINAVTELNNENKEFLENIVLDLNANIGNYVGSTKRITEATIDLQPLDQAEIIELATTHLNALLLKDSLKKLNNPTENVDKRTKKEAAIYSKSDSGDIDMCGNDNNDFRNRLNANLTNPNPNVRLFTPVIPPAGSFNVSNLTDELILKLGLRNLMLQKKRHLMMITQIRNVKEYKSPPAWLTDLTKAKNNNEVLAVINNGDPAFVNIPGHNENNDNDVNASDLPELLTTDIAKKAVAKVNVLNIKKAIFEITDAKILTEIEHAIRTASKSNYLAVFNKYRVGNSGSNHELFENIVGNVDFDDKSFPPTVAQNVNIHGAVVQQRNLQLAFEWIDKISTKSADNAKRLALDNLTNTTLSLGDYALLIQQHNSAAAVPPVAGGSSELFNGCPFQLRLPGSITSDDFPPDGFNQLQKYAQSKNDALIIQSAVDNVKEFDAANKIKPIINKLTKTGAEFRRVVNEKAVDGEMFDELPTQNANRLNDKHVDDLITHNQERKNGLELKEMIAKFDQAAFQDPNKKNAIKALAQIGDGAHDDFRLAVNAHRSLLFPSLANNYNDKTLSSDTIADLGLRDFTRRKFHQLLIAEIISNISDLNGRALREFLQGLANAANMEAFCEIINRNRGAGNFCAEFLRPLVADDFLAPGDEAIFKQLKELAVQRQNELQINAVIDNKPYERITELDPIIVLPANDDLRRQLMENHQIGGGHLIAEIDPATNRATNKVNLPIEALERIKKRANHRQCEKIISNAVKRVDSVTDAQQFNDVINATPDKIIEKLNEKKRLYGIEDMELTPASFSPDAAKRLQDLIRSQYNKLKVLEKLGPIKAALGMPSGDDTEREARAREIRQQLDNTPFLRAIARISSNNPDAVRGAISQHLASLGINFTAGVSPEQHLSDEACENIRLTMVEHYRLLQGHSKELIARDAAREKWLIEQNAPGNEAKKRDTYINVTRRIAQYEFRIADHKKRIPRYDVQSAYRDETLEKAVHECTQYLNELTLAKKEAEARHESELVIRISKAINELDMLFRLEIDNPANQKGTDIYYNAIQAFNDDYDVIDRTGKTEEEVNQEIQEKIALHVGGHTVEGGILSASRKIKVNEADPNPIVFKRFIGVNTGIRKIDAVAVSSTYIKQGDKHELKINAPANLPSGLNSESFYAKWAIREVETFRRLGLKKADDPMVFVGDLNKDFVKAAIKYCKVMGYPCTCLVKGLTEYRPTEHSESNFRKLLSDPANKADFFNNKGMPDPIKKVKQDQDIVQGTGYIPPTPMK